MTHDPRIVEPPPRQSPGREIITVRTIDVIRRVLLATMVVGFVGLFVELLLLEHFDDWQQYIPLVLIALSLLTLGWYALSKSWMSVRVLQGAMWLSIVSGAIGTLLHYQGNAEFEKEMMPGAAGWELFRDSMMGATPALAPGAMIQLGLIGLAWSFRHPALNRGLHISHTTQEVER